MKKIQLGIKLMNKGPYDRSVIKMSHSEEVCVPKEKHVRRILQALQGKDPKKMAYEALQFYLEQISQINPQKNWLSGIRILCIFHQNILEDYKGLINLSKHLEPLEKLNYIQSPYEDRLTFIMATICVSYQMYLVQMQYQYHLVAKYHKVIGLSVLDEDFMLKIPDLMAIVKLAKLVIKVEKDVQQALKNYGADKIIFLKQIGKFLYQDAVKIHEILDFFVDLKIHLIFEYSPPQIHSIYELYQEFMTISRGMRKIQQLTNLILPFRIAKNFNFQEINIEKNKEIEIRMLQFPKNNNILYSGSNFNSNSSIQHDKNYFGSQKSLNSTNNKNTNGKNKNNQDPQMQKQNYQQQSYTRPVSPLNNNNSNEIKQNNFFIQHQQQQNTNSSPKNSIKNINNNNNLDLNNNNHPHTMVFNTPQSQKENNNTSNNNNLNDCNINNSNNIKFSNSSINNSSNNNNNNNKLTPNNNINNNSIIQQQLQNSTPIIKFLDDKSIITNTEENDISSVQSQEITQNNNSNNFPNINNTKQSKVL